MINNINVNMQVYDKICVDYIAETFDNYHQEAVEQFLKYAEMKDKILELGTGSGNNLTYMFGQGRDVRGSDNVLGFFEWISTRFACPFSLIDFSDVDFVNSFQRDHEIMHLFCNLALQHLTSRELQYFFSKIEFKGVLFFSLYDGVGERVDEQGIFSTYYKHRQITKVLNERFEILEQWFCEDVLKSKKQMLNYVIKLK